MPDASGHHWRAQSRVLAISVGWMLLVQVLCALLWDAGLLTRQASLIHWLVIGMLPPGLALWGMGEAAPQR